MKQMEIYEFVRRLKASMKTSDNRFSFFLGAGCSISSGIPAASTLVGEWLQQLKLLKTGTDEHLEEWAKETFDKFDCNNLANHYGEIINELFINSEERQKEIERICEGNDPGFGYSVLAKLLTHELYKRNFNTILTTNFDDMVTDALYIYTKKKPLIIHHESLVAYARMSRMRPMVLKLHGDARFSPKNTTIETQNLDEGFKKVLNTLLSEVGLIFVGYGGNDESIYTLLNDLPKTALPYGIYWISNRLPTGKMRNWLEERNAIWVKHLDFDELMLLINKEFNLEPPNWERLDIIKSKYDETLKRLSKAINSRQEDSTKKLLQQEFIDTMKKFNSWISVVAEADRLKNKDISEAIKVFEEGIKQYPNNSELLCEYGTFILENGLDCLKAEECYKKAIENNPNDVVSISNYAFFLSNYKNEYDKAQMYFEKVCRMSPNFVNNLVNYSAFLRKVRKDYDNAFVYLKRAIRLGSNDSNLFLQYGIFLSEIHERHDEAESYFLKAIEKDSKNVNNVLGYARFLKNVRQDYIKAKDYLETALDIDPNHSDALGNYANFLFQISKNYNKAKTFYLKALKVDKNNPIKMSNYASFLKEIGEYDQSIEFFQKTLEIDPYNVFALANYAILLWQYKGEYDKADEIFIKMEHSDIREISWQMWEVYGDFLVKKRHNYEKAKSIYYMALDKNSDDAELLEKIATLIKRHLSEYEKAEEFYTKSLEINPNNPRTLFEYADFIRACCRDYDRAELYYKKAIDEGDESSLYPYILANYAAFLYEHRGKVEDADNYYRMALEIMPNNPQILKGYSIFLKNIKKGIN